MKCPVCNQIGKEYLKAQPLDIEDGDFYTYYYCSGCEIIYLAKVENEKTERVDYSESGYYSKVESKFKTVISTAMRVFIFCRLSLVRRGCGDIRGKSILDIGCGKGKFLHLAKSAGAIVHGIEPTVRSYEFAKRELGDSVQNEMMVEGLFPPQSFDIITMWHVFEHMPEPIDILKTCRQVLRPNGSLVIAVPNYNGWIAKKGREVWFNLDPPRHVIHYTPESLTRLLFQNGYEVIKISHSYPELTIFSALQSMLNRLSNKLRLTPNFLFNLLKQNKKALPSSFPAFIWNISIAGSLSFVLLPVVMLFVPLATLMGKSDCITIIARKSNS